MFIKRVIHYFRSAELLICIGVTVVVAGLHAAGVFERFELTTIDTRFKLRGNIPTRPEIAFIDMAEDSIRSIGRWPWPREWHATLVSVLNEFKPKAVAFDVLFVEPSAPEMDGALAKALKDAGFVYLPFLIEYDKDAVSGITFPIPELQESAHAFGYLDFASDVDGVVRRVPLAKKIQGKYYYHMAFKVVCDYLGVPESNIEIVPGENIYLRGTKKGDITIPIDDKCQMMLNWAGRWAETFSHYSFYETILAYKQLEEKQEPVMNLNLYRGKICFVGLTATGTFDTKPIPFETLYPMVGVHGTVVNCILNGCFLREMPLHVDLLCLFALCFLTSLIVYFLRPLFGGILTGVLVLLYLAAGYLSFARQGLLTDVVAPSCGVIFTYLSIVLYRYLAEEKQRKWIKNIFSHYLSPEIIEQLINNPDQLKLGGVRRELTVLFSDIRSFTTFSESHTPEEVVALLNEYLDAMTKVILKNRGTLDKFVGDEIMAVWGAPLELPTKEQAILATRTAVEMCDRLMELHDKWQKEGKIPLGMGVGINTGEMISGNMGSAEVFDYTVIGDNVNIGARVEALTRKYPTNIIITEATYSYIKDEPFIFRELDSIVVKGKTKPIKIYSVDGFAAEGTEEGTATSDGPT